MSEQAIGNAGWIERHQRPRERVMALGPGLMSNAELLAVLFGTGSGGSAIELAQQTLGQLGGLRPTLKASAHQLLAIPGLGPAKVTRLMAAFELGIRACTVEEGDAPILRSSVDVFRAYRARLGVLEKEVFWVVLLDSRHRRLRDVQISEGSLNAVQVHPREVFRPAVRDGAAKLICLHNHPSGDPDPSREDIALTERLVEVGHLLGLPILDHIIIGGQNYTSLADEGFISEMDGMAKGLLSVRDSLFDIEGAC